MQDRIPGKPNRKKITYEDGTVQYATIEYADEPIAEGTPISKATLLQDDTAAALALGENPTVDDALKKLSTGYCNKKEEKIFQPLQNWNTCQIEGYAGTDTSSVRNNILVDIRDGVGIVVSDYSTSNNFAFTTRDGGKTWIFDPLPIKSTFADVAVYQGRYGIVLGKGGAVYIQDVIGGNDGWKQLDTGSSNLTRDYNVAAADSRYLCFLQKGSNHIAITSSDVNIDGAVVDFEEYTCSGLPSRGLDTIRLVGDYLFGEENYNVQLYVAPVNDPESWIRLDDESDIPYGAEIVYKSPYYYAFGSSGVYRTSMPSNPSSWIKLSATGIDFNRISIRSIVLSSSDIVLFEENDDGDITGAYYTTIDGISYNYHYYDGNPISFSGSTKVFCCNDVLGSVYCIFDDPIRNAYSCKMQAASYYTENMDGSYIGKAVFQEFGEVSVPVNNPIRLTFHFIPTFVIISRGLSAHMFIRPVTNEIQTSSYTPKVEARWDINAIVINETAEYQTTWNYIAFGY